MRYSLYVERESPSFPFMCLESIKWNSNLLGDLFFSPTLVLFLGVCKSWYPGIITLADGIRCLWSISTEISTEYLFVRLAHQQKLKLDKPWALGMSSPLWTASFWLELDPRASCTQRQRKFASGDGFQVLSMLDFFPAPLWVPLYHCAVALTGKTEIL